MAWTIAARKSRANQDQSASPLSNLRTQLRERIYGCPNKCPTCQESIQFDGTDYVLRHCGREICFMCGLDGDPIPSTHWLGKGGVCPSGPNDFYWRAYIVFPHDLKEYGVRVGAGVGFTIPVATQMATTRNQLHVTRLLDALGATDVKILFSIIDDWVISRLLPWSKEFDGLKKYHFDLCWSRNDDND